MDPLFIKAKYNNHAAWHEVDMTQIGREGSGGKGGYMYRTVCGMSFFGSEVRSSPHGQGERCRKCELPPLQMPDQANTPSRLGSVGDVRDWLAGLPGQLVEQAA